MLAGVVGQPPHTHPNLEHVHGCAPPHTPTNWEHMHGRAGCCFAERRLSCLVVVVGVCSSCTVRHRHVQAGVEWGGQCMLTHGHRLGEGHSDAWMEPFLSLVALYAGLSLA